MRGKVRELLFSFHCARITPAYAGKSRVGGTILRFNWDHPRVCGEKASFVSSMQNRPGSPPRMRGKVGHCLSVDSRSGITPAYAGKRPKQAVGSFQPRDHPRVCGEKGGDAEVKDAAQGITPACAGKSTICGEWQQTFGGSPPHVRGKDMDTLQTVHDARITPACAGKRLKRSRSTVPPVAIVPLFPSVCNKPVVSDGSPAGRDAPLFLPAENAVPASPAYNLRSL